MFPNAKRPKRNTRSSNALAGPSKDRQGKVYVRSPTRSTTTCDPSIADIARMLNKAVDAFNMWAKENGEDFDS